MFHRISLAILASALLIPGPSPAAEPGTSAPRAQFIALRVELDAGGKVISAKPMDSTVLPALNRAGEEIARKLVFTPARKDGRAVPSETTLSLTLALEPRADGQFGLALKRAQNGPSIVAIGKAGPIKFKQDKDNGALVVVGVDLKPDGSVDIASLKPERTEMRVHSSFAEKRYLDAISKSLRGTRFQLDKVEGIEVPAHVSAPYRFGTGPTKAVDPSDEPGRPGKPPEDMDLPSLNAKSLIPGIELPRIDFSAPAKT